MAIMEKGINKQSNGFGVASPQAGGNSTGVSAGLRLAIVFAFILGLLSLTGSACLYQSLNAERRERQALEGAQDQIRQKSVNLEKVADDYKSQIEELQTKLQDGENERKQFKKAIEETRGLIAVLQEKLKAAEEIKNKALELQAQAASSPVVSAPAVIAGAGEEASEEEAGTPANTEFAAPKAAPTKPSAPLRTPQVLTVNRKFNFVVVSLGVKDGIQMGDSIEILRQGKVIGNAQVEKLYENFAAATIVREPKEDPIKEGDSIRKLS